jgi:hypothetical protein
MEERGGQPQLPGPGIPPGRRLPSGASQIDRLTQHTVELKNDLMAWVDLKIKHVKLELEEKLDAQKKTIAIYAAMAVFAIYGVTFLLVTVALFIGWLLGHAAWGFLVVTALLLGLAALLYALRGRLTSPGDKKMDVANKSLSHRTDGENRQDG